MERITEAPHQGFPSGIVLVVDEYRKLIGAVTDGDIRKALVKGFTMDDSLEQVMSRNPITVDESLSVDEMVKTVFEKVKESRRIRDFKVDKVIITKDGQEVVDLLDFYELWYKQEVRYKKLCIVGVGHVGLTLAVVLGDLGYKVIGMDTNEKLVEKLNRGEVDFYEKGLRPLLRLHLKEKSLKFISRLNEEAAADIYIICVGTPIDGQTNKPMNVFIEKAAEDVGRILKKDNLVILRSTVTVGTTRSVVLPILEKESSLKAGLEFSLVFAPERVVEGKALEEIREIPQIIGGLNKKSVQEATRVLQTISPSVVILDSLEEAEMAKLINNTFRDYSFAFANHMALLCDPLNIDAVKLIKAASEGYPRNPVPLPSPGVGGYCLTKDPYLLADVARRHDLNPEIFIQGRKINNAMPEFVANKVVNFISRHWSKADKLKIYLMGFAFKGYPETSDMRGSPTLQVVKTMRQKLAGRINLCGFDAVIKKEEIEKLQIEYLPYEKGFKNAHGVLIMNNHPDFTKLDIFTLLELMKKPGLLFDGWQFFLPQEINKIKGIAYHGLGGFH